MPVQKLTKLFAPKIPLVLEVEGEHRLELQLSWTMRAAVLIESLLRERGIHINILQEPTRFWGEMDCTMLSTAVWACAQQNHPEYANDKSFDAIESFLVPDNYNVALKAVRDAYIESLGPERRERIKQIERDRLEKEALDQSQLESKEGKDNPTPAHETSA